VGSSPAALGEGLRWYSPGSLSGFECMGDSIIASPANVKHKIVYRIIILCRNRGRGTWGGDVGYGKWDIVYILEGI
jgi:hypothetical protein